MKKTKQLILYFTIIAIICSFVGCKGKTPSKDIISNNDFATIELKGLISEYENNNKKFNNKYKNKYIQFTSSITDIDESKLQFIESNALKANNTTIATCNIYNDVKLPNLSKNDTVTVKGKITEIKNSILGIELLIETYSVEIEEPNEEYTVQITMDNWNDYFEVAEVIEPKCNEFDEVIYALPVNYFVLKNQDKYDNVIIDVAIEYDFALNYWYYDMKLKNDKITWEEMSEYKEPNTDYEVDKRMAKITDFETCIFHASDSLKDKSGRKLALRCTDFNMYRIQGTLKLTDKS